MSLSCVLPVTPHSIYTRFLFQSHKTSMFIWGWLLRLTNSLYFPLWNSRYNVPSMANSAPGIGCCVMFDHIHLFGGTGLLHRLVSPSLLSSYSLQADMMTVRLQWSHCDHRCRRWRDAERRMQQPFLDWYLKIDANATTDSMEYFFLSFHQPVN